MKKKDNRSNDTIYHSFVKYILRFTYKYEPFRIIFKLYERMRAILSCFIISQITNQRIFTMSESNKSFKKWFDYHLFANYMKKRKENEEYKIKTYTNIFIKFGDDFIVESVGSQNFSRHYISPTFWKIIKKLQSQSASL
jgi:hypothetical protein